jgi:hypothetical protein
VADGVSVMVDVGFMILVDVGLGAGVFVTGGEGDVVENLNCAAVGILFEPDDVLPLLSRGEFVLHAANSTVKIIKIRNERFIKKSSLKTEHSFLDQTFGRLNEVRKGCTIH